MGLISKYSGLNFIELNNLDYIDYLILRRDAFIDSMNKTEEGRKYLYNAWLLEQTDADRGTLRELFK